LITFYEVVKFVHIVAAIVAVGFNLSYGVLVARAAREPEHQLHVLQTVKVLDDRFANPAYGVVLATGLLNVFTSPVEITEFWVLGGLVLFVLLTLGGVLGYTPALRRQIAALEAGGPQSPAYEQAAQRSQSVAMILLVTVIGVVFLMVTKPTL
jgi:uncharacterized membrane protein